MKKAKEKPVERGIPKVHKPPRRNEKLPSIEKIVKMRIDADIAGFPERELYLKGDLDESSYSDEFKRQLLYELEQAKHK